jgi:hypothetical protein
VAAARLPNGVTRLLAATRAGLIRSDDLGDSWTADWAGMADPNVVAVAFAGQVAAGWPTAFAATETGRLYRSDDGGVIWAEVTGWAGLGVAAVLAPSPTFADDAILFVGTAEGIFRSLDGGASWESSNFGLIDVDMLCLTCAPDFATSQALWAGSAGGGLYRSRNQGRAWREAGIGLPDAPVQAVAVSPSFAEDRTLYAGLEGHGVYWSRDGGENWSPCGQALAGQSVNALLTLDGGRGLVAATENGLFVADAAGEQWVEAAGSHPAVLALAAAGEFVAAGTYLDGVLAATDGGRTWQETATPALHVPPLVAASGAHWAASDLDGALAVSADGGSSWQTIAPPDVDSLFALAVQPDATGTPILAATSDGLWSLDTLHGVWQKLDAPGLPAGPLLAVEFAAGGAARLAYRGDGSLFAAVDGASDWQEITGPWQGQMLLRALPAQDEAGALAALALTLMPNEQGHYAIQLWLYQAGAWTGLASMAADIPSMLVAWPQMDRIWLATQHRIMRLYRDTPAAAWGAYQHFFTAGEQVTALYPARDADGVWAATTQALYQSPGPGAPWTRVAELPERQPVVFLRAAPAHLEAVTLGGRVWRATPLPG